MSVDLAAAYDAVADIARGSRNLEESWKSLIDYGESLIPGKEWASLRELNIAKDVTQVKEQIKLIIKNEPIPSEVTCLYFGLFEAIYEGSDKPSAGYYISGVVKYDPDDSDSVCDPFYFPEHRFIQSNILDAIMDKGQAKVATSSLMDYAIMLGAASLISKYAIKEELNYQLVVGFDSGDLLQV